MLTQVATKVGELVAQRAVQIGIAGILSGAIVGTTAVAVGLVPLVPPPRPVIALLDCPGSSRIVARVPSGTSLLVTARSFDGHWVEVYVGEPGIDRGWVPANTVRLQDSADRLPVGGCDQTAVAVPSFATPAPIDTFGPPASLPPVVVADTAAPTLPSPSATPRPTAIAHATATPKATVKPSAFVPTPPPSLSPTPPPPPPPTPTPTPAPTPVNDTTPPTLSNLHATLWCLDSSVGYSSSDIVVTVTDSQSPIGAVRIQVAPPGLIGGTFNMTFIGNNTWKYTVTWSSNMTAGQYVDYSVRARDIYLNWSDWQSDGGPGNTIQVRTVCYLG